MDMDDRAGVWAVAFSDVAWAVVGASDEALDEAVVGGRRLARE